MASIVFDARRGAYAIQWHDGRKYVRSPVHRIARWKPGAGRPKRDPLEVERALVEFKDRERRARLGGRVDPDRTVAEFLSAYQAAYVRARAAGSADQLGQAVRTFLAWCEAEGVKRLDRITPAVCRKWIEARAGETSRKTGRPIGHATLAKERALLAAAWARAVKHEELDRNPWAPVEVPAREEKPPKGSWSPEEYARLAAASRPWLRDLLAVGCHTGIRISALLGLEWRDVKWSEGPLGLVVVRPELDKAGKGYTVPLHRVAHDVLARRRAMKDCDRCLAGMGGKPTTMNVTGTAIIRACERAGLPKPSSPNHHMRRTFGRWAVVGHLTGKPVPLYVVSRWMGHASVQMTEAYLDLKRDESSEWMGGEG